MMRRTVPTGLFVLLFVLLIGLVGWQAPQPIPPFEGDGNSMHDGQPKWCSNVDTKTHAKNCDCKPMMGDPECKDGKEGGGAETQKCKVYCRKTSCRCLPGCGHTE
jgi:hypothetical protein